jgi:hypothetical protein
MPSPTIITFNIDAGALVIGTVIFFLGLLTIVWKGKDEVGKAIKSELNPFRNMAHAITEIQTILADRFKGLAIKHSMVETGDSPLKPTQYGAQLIRDSGLEKILYDNKEALHDKLRASLQEGYTEYDVQENAREILVGLKDDPMLRPVKEYVYDHPMDIEIILRVGGLWLKDDFFHQPREISQK